MKRASCGPFLSFSLPGPPFSLTPIHYGYCQVPDKNHCASSSYSQEDRRQKEWQTHVKIYWRKTNSPSFSASSCRESALLATLSFGELLSQQGTRDRCAHSSHSKCCDVWTVTADRNYIWHPYVEYMPKCNTHKNKKKKRFKWRRQACRHVRACLLSLTSEDITESYSLTEVWQTHEWNAACWNYRHNPPKKTTKNRFWVKSGM